MGLLATLLATALSAGAALGPGEPVAPQPPRCEPQALRCAEATGPIIAVESIDPDGDGDAHFVLFDPGGVSAPGVTIVDVARELRPRPLPGAGKVLSAAGPVYRGSYGQRQIQAEEVVVGASPTGARGPGAG
jgi:hypothetical protein